MSLLTYTSAEIANQLCNLAREKGINIGSTPLMLGQVWVMIYDWQTKHNGSPVPYRAICEVALQENPSVLDSLPGYMAQLRKLGVIGCVDHASNQAYIYVDVYNAVEQARQVNIDQAKNSDTTMADPEGEARTTLLQHNFARKGIDLTASEVHKLHKIWWFVKDRECVSLKDVLAYMFPEVRLESWNLEMINKATEQLAKLMRVEALTVSNVVGGQMYHTFRFDMDAPDGGMAQTAPLWVDPRSNTRKLQQVWLWTKAHGWCSKEDIAKHCYMSEESAQAHIQVLLNAGGLCPNPAHGNWTYLAVDFDWGNNKMGPLEEPKAPEQSAKGYAHGQSDDVLFTPTPQVREDGAVISSDQDDCVTVDIEKEDLENLRVIQRRLTTLLGFSPTLLQTVGHFLKLCADEATFHRVHAPQHQGDAFS